MKKSLKKIELSKILGGTEVKTGGVVSTTTCGDKTCTTSQSDSFDDKNDNGIRDSNESGTSTISTICK